MAKGFGQGFSRGGGEMTYIRKIQIVFRFLRVFGLYPTNRLRVAKDFTDRFLI